MYAVLLAYRPCHRGGDYACHRAGVLGHRAGGAAGVDDVVQQQAAELVAGDDAVFAVGSAHHRAYAVGVGVGADDEVAVHALCQIDREIEALGILGVRALDRREAPVNDHLLLNGVEVLYAEAAQRFGDELVAAAVERGVYYAQVVRDLFDDFLVYRLSHDVFEEYLVSFLADYLDLTLGDSLVKVAGLEAGEDVYRFHLLCDGFGLMGRQLCAVGPVDLVAVIFLGIVACRDVEAGSRAVVQHRKAQLRRRAQRVEEADVYAVCRHDAGRLLGKLHAVETAVVRDDYAAALCVLAVGKDDVCEGLSRVADYVYVHVVQAELHRAAQTCRAEFERGIEAVFYLLLVTGYGIEFLPLFFAECRAVQPALVFFHIGL